MTNTKAETPRELYNILLLGDPRTGKTHFFNELCETYTSEVPLTPKAHSKSIMPSAYINTTNIDICTFDYNIRGHNMRIQLWDTPGSSAYQQIVARFMTKPFNMIIIMFTADTISKVSHWIEFINKQKLSYTPTIVLMENGHTLAQYPQHQSPDTFIIKYPYLKFSINLCGQSSYILKTIIEEAIIDKSNTTPICCRDRKNNRCCF